MRLCSLAVALSAAALCAVAARADGDTQRWAVPQLDWLRKANIACMPGDRLAADTELTRAAWSGTCKDSMVEGAGTLTLGRKYFVLTVTGSFTHGLVEGPASIDEVAINVGDNAQEPVLHFEGSMHGNLPDGPGVLRYADGYRVQGVYKANVLGGKVAIDELDGSHTDGTYADDVWRRPTVLTFSDGSRETVLSDLPAYHSKLVYPDGTTLEIVGSTATYSDAEHHTFKGAYVKPQPLPRAAAAYPMISRKLNEEGMAMFSLFVAADGTVDRLRIRYSTGSKWLDAAALAAVAQWRFSPATVDGRAVADWTFAALQFRLSKPQAAPRAD